MQSISVYPSHYVIDGVRFIPKVLDNKLTKWDPVYFKKYEIGYYYNKEKNELRIPRGFPLEVLESIFPEHMTHYYGDEYDSYDKIKISLTSAPRDYKQEHELTFMLGQSPYQVTEKERQLYVDLDTGEGKTFCGVASLCFYGCRGVIFTPAISKVSEQWMSSIERFTTLKYSEYLYVRGSQMCVDIIARKYKDVKIFVIPRSTILAFIKKFNDNWEMLERLMKAMNVGIKIIDEAHMDFSTIVNIDCFTNVAKTYYMSSSPSRSDITEKKKYARIFKNVPRFGKKLKSSAQNHIMPLIMFFKSTPSPMWISKVKTRYGTSLAKYGEYLLDDTGARDEFIEAFLYAMLMMQKLRRNNGKILVICVTIAFAKDLANVCKEAFPNLSIGLYVGSGKDKSKELNNDVIFSTKESMGTGSEIENHQLTINTLTYSSEVMVDQLSGRIRRNKDPNAKTVYCEIVNIAHPVARKHYEKREKYLVKKAKNGKIQQVYLTNDHFNYCDKFIRDGKTVNGNGMVLKNNRIIMERRKKK